MTEAIQLLAVTQGMFMVNIDNKIQNAIATANVKQCESCHAMKHAVKVDEEQKNKELIDAWKKANGISDDPAD